MDRPYGPAGGIAPIARSPSVTPVAAGGAVTSSAAGNSAHKIFTTIAACPASSSRPASAGYVTGTANGVRTQEGALGRCRPSGQVSQRPAPGGATGPAGPARSPVAPDAANGADDAGLTGGAGPDAPVAANASEASKAATRSSATKPGVTAGSVVGAERRRSHGQLAVVGDGTALAKPAGTARPPRRAGHTS